MRLIGRAFRRSGGPTGREVRALRGLVKSGKVSRAGSGKKGDPYRYAPPGDSSTPVPTTTPVQENGKPKSDETLLQKGLDSCTRDSASVAVRRAVL